MKILLVSMASLHLFRWTEQLRDSGHEVYWFDVLDGGATVDRLDFVHQKVGWKRRWNFPGRFFLKKKLPLIYKFTQLLNERKTSKAFEAYLKEVQPDVVHSFAWNMSGRHILKVMNKNSIPLIFSSWGSDIYYFEKEENIRNEIVGFFKRVDYIFTDCYRDRDVIKRLKFKGKFMNVLPGGGGYDMENLSKMILPLDKKSIILIKGYENNLGKCIYVLNELEQLKSELKDFEIVVFGASKPVFDYVDTSTLKHWKNFQVKGKVSHNEVLGLMGKSLIYIGYSISDGIPNSLIEAICMDVFPIQSNPGKVTEEIIVDGENGYLLNDINQLKSQISSIINDKDKIKKALLFNSNLKCNYEFKTIKDKTLNDYRLIENQVFISK